MTAWNLEMLAAFKKCKVKNPDSKTRGDRHFSHFLQF